MLSSSLNYAVQPLHYLKTSPMAYVKIPKGSRTNYRSSQYKREVIEKDIIDEIFVRFPKGSSTYLPLMFAYHCGIDILGIVSIGVFPNQRIGVKLRKQ